MGDTTRIPRPLAAALSLLCALLSTGCVHTARQQVMFQAMVDRPGDGIEIQETDAATVFVVTSTSGIGSATVTRWQGRWPSDLRVRLRYAEGRPFTKVEGFSCAAGSRRPVELETVIYRPDSAEVPLPPEVLGGGVSTLHLRWVDYYRQ
jgi:hypothetical protein